MARAGDALRAALVDWTAAAGAPEKAGHAATALLAAAGEALASAPAPADAERRLWHEYLGVTGDAGFLERLPDAAGRHRWADTAIAAIRRSDYSLQTLLAQRVASHPDRVLFSDDRDPHAPRWTYAQAAWYVRAVAATLLEARPEPRVAIFSDNSVDAACVDLACLLHGVMVSPLNVHFDAETLAWIFERLQIDVVVTDTLERMALLATVRERTGRDFAVFRTGSRAEAASVRGLTATPLRSACAGSDRSAVAARLAAREVNLMAPATVMFTSGSTGRPKGVVFNLFNLVTKRFARAAALPSVGHEEVLLCYLPLFHTFGRFLELLGTIYWGGTYVFASGPSAEALVADLARVRPTGLISVPVRWAQLREQCLGRMDDLPAPAQQAVAFREVVGDRLRWGLSAAGHLDASVFRFFQRHGVDLCSGFGMTEATGGITMTPPGAYVDGTVGVPLPGVRVRFGEHGELQFSGAYAARYLDEAGPAGSLPVLDPDEDYWVPTGDLFRTHPNGYLEIVDRIKDIYKNSRGQTVAPQRVEQRFAAVPGIRRTFLAGDHRDYNTLLIVLDAGDPVVASRTPEQVHEYLGQIVASVNEGLAPNERVVRFAVLDRDFSPERGELTPKGSLRRRTIAEHFAGVIETLYRASHVDLTVGDLRVRIPRWFFRDLAVLEGDIVARDGGLVNTRTGARLRVGRAADGFVRVGDLLYGAGGEIVDLGLFARQPRLWLGNPALVAFAPCKPGWEAASGTLPDRVQLPRPGSPVTPAAAPVAAPAGRVPGDDRLREAHDLLSAAAFAPEADALVAIGRLSDLLTCCDDRVAAVLRRRLGLLARRPEEEVRALAYRVLLLVDADDDPDHVFTPFIDSGRTFLTPVSIEAIARARPGERRLLSLRRRLYTYRTRLAWPGPPARRAQFAHVLQLLADFARHDPESVPAVEAELATWALFREEPALARRAARQLDALTAWDERASGPSPAAGPDEVPVEKVIFNFAIPSALRARLRRVLFDRSLLARSLARAFGEDGFAWARVPPGGVWVMPVLSHPPLLLFRVAVNFDDGRHFDLLLVTGEPLRRRKAVGDTMLWLAALSDHALGSPALPRFGVWRRDLGAATIAYVNQLTAWERIRDLSRVEESPDGEVRERAWRTLYVRAMSTFFRAWAHSGYRIVPGALAPSNVAVPDSDVHEGTTILSLAGWRPYDGPASFVDQLHRNFYRQTAACHPRSRERLRISWIFDACVEAVGSETAAGFLDTLAGEWKADAPGADAARLTRALDDYRRGLETRPYVPLPVTCAIQRFGDWERANPSASREAREEAVLQMLHLYRLDRFHDAFRFHLYRHTYFARARAEVGEAFDRHVAGWLGRHPDRHGSLEDLSVLQHLLVDSRDRGVFSRMVFPRASRAQGMEILELGRPDDRRVLVRSHIADDAGTPYEVRTPVTPVEVGRLYQLVLEADFPKRITAEDRHLAIVDRQDRVVGGLLYQWHDARTVHVDAIAVSAGLRARGLGGRLIEDFCVRMASEGVRCVKTSYFLSRLFTAHGFHVDQRRGGLVRFLEAPAGDGAAGDSGLW